MTHPHEWRESLERDQLDYKWLIPPRERSLRLVHKALRFQRECHRLLQFQRKVLVRERVSKTHEFW